MVCFLVARVGRVGSARTNAAGPMYGNPRTALNLRRGAIAVCWARQTRHVTAPGRRFDPERSFPAWRSSVRMFLPRAVACPENCAPVSFWGCSGESISGRRRREMPDEGLVNLNYRIRATSKKSGEIRFRDQCAHRFPCKTACIAES